MTPFALSVTDFFSLGTIVLNIVFIVLILSLIFLKKSEFIAFVSKHALNLATLVSVLGVLGSLLYSSVIGFVPCELCWWQRIFLFPQAIIFVIAFISKKKIKDHIFFLYSLVLSILGACVALYHYYGQMFNPSALSACATQGASCAKIYFVSFGYITIPMMSLSIFLVLGSIALVKVITVK